MTNLCKFHGMELGMTTNVSAMINSDAFAGGHTFSFTRQPYLGQMFGAVLDLRTPLTIMAGAGVSMNSSLPSWEGLVLNMAAAISDQDLSRMAAKDQCDPMRRAEVIMHLLKGCDGNAEEHEFIRDALYQRDRSFAPGQLAFSIARLVRARERKVRLVTTNFDDVLEQALSLYFDETRIRGFSLAQLKEWEEWTADADGIGVLHLHGIIRQAESPTEPVVLTESQYLKYGSCVRAVVSKTLQESNSIFVGLGMADPNLVGPLYETRQPSHQRFALVVPRRLPGESTANSSTYAVASAKYLEDELMLRPIFLKSYSQLNHVLADLSLAFVEKVRYRWWRPGRAPLVYGRRLITARDSCYKAIGCKKQETVPAADAANELANRLHAALHHKHGPVELLKGLHSKYYIGSKAAPEDERFALFLWLRTRPEKSVDARYSLTLVGTSAYAHRESWSMHREEPISEDSDYAAAQAVFYGATKAVNLDTSKSVRPWRGVVAAPIVLADTGSFMSIGPSPADVLTVGAITLNSTHKVHREADEALRSVSADYSIVSELDSQDYVTLMEAMQYAAKHVLTPTI